MHSSNSPTLLGTTPLWLLTHTPSEVSKFTSKSGDLDQLPTVVVLVDEVGCAAVEAATTVVQEAKEEETILRTVAVAALCLVEEEAA